MNTVGLFDVPVVFNDTIKKYSNQNDSKTVTIKEEPTGKDKVFYDVQDYFSLFGGRIVVERTPKEGRFSVVQYLNKSQPVWLTALKVISYLTIIIPVIIASIRISLLRSYGFNIRVISSHNDKLECKLAEELDDIGRARLLMKAYTKNIQNTLSKSDRKIFEKYLIKYSPYLGSHKFNNGVMFGDLKWFNKATFGKRRFKEKFDAFILDLRNSTNRQLPEPAQNTAKKIAILYTGLGGGGHKAPAMAIQAQLKAKGYNVEMVDTDEIGLNYEPKVFGRGFEDIWTEFYQKKGMPKFAQFLWKMHKSLYHPECRKTNQIVRERLEKFNPDLIFTVAHHKPKLAALAYTLNKKMIYVHTDNLFSGQLLGLAQTQAHCGAPLVKFTKPTTAPSDYFENLERPQPIYGGYPRGEGPSRFTSQGVPTVHPTYPEERESKNNLHRHTHHHSKDVKYVRTKRKPPITIRQQLLDLQIPVRPDFQPVTRAEQDGIKRELGIEPSTKVCMVMMGNNGVEGEARNILQKLYAERREAREKLHVFFICGRNKPFADELNRKLREQSFDGTNIKVEVKEFLEAPQMAKVAKSADVWIAKFGGSTSAEALAMRKQVLTVSILNHEWKIGMP